jgi:hypothetical protein
MSVIIQSSLLPWGCSRGACGGLGLAGRSGCDILTGQPPETDEMIDLQALIEKTQTAAFGAR